MRGLREVGVSQLSHGMAKGESKRKRETDTKVTVGDSHEQSELKAAKGGQTPTPARAETEKVAAVTKKKGSSRLSQTIWQLK